LGSINLSISTMKRLLFVFAFLAMCAGHAFSQAPNCQNDNALENRIDAIENQGWVEVNREFVPYNYLVEPETPFIIGELHVTFAPDCPPGVGCPAIAMLYIEAATATSQNACHWNRMRQ
jgi:hypothetical protein